VTETVTLKEHFAALREADQRAVDLVREWTRERLETHNNLLRKWQEATEKDRESFARKETLDSLHREFATYKEITAKALTLAEGKSKGIDLVKGAASFVAGLLIALVAVWAATEGLR